VIFLHARGKLFDDVKLFSVKQFLQKQTESCYIRVTMGDRVSGKYRVN